MSTDDNLFPPDSATVTIFSEDISKARAPEYDLEKVAKELEAQSLRVSREYNYKTPIPYYAVGKTVDHYDTTRRISKDTIMKDILTHINEMTKAEGDFYLAVHYSMDHNTNIGDNAKPDDPSKSNSYSRAYAKLKRKDIIRRIRNDVYMVNPLLVIPKEYDQAAILWSKLK